MPNNRYPYAVRLKLPIDRPFTDPDWFDSLPIPPYWFDYTEGKRVTLNQTEHALTEYSYTEDREELFWPEHITDYWKPVDIFGNEISEVFIHPRFSSFLDERGLQISAWDVFITPPNMKLRVHKDSLVERVKLNFSYIFAEGYSQQNYYVATEESEEIYPPNDFEGLLNNGKLEHIHNLSKDWSKPSLTNVGLWHEVVNSSPGPRVCLSYQLKRKQDSDPSVWDDVYPLLEDLIVEE